MNLTPIETAGFENAWALLDACRSELEKGGFSDQADALRGIEVLDRSGAEVALMTLRELPEASEDLDMFKRHVGRVLYGLLRKAVA